jgi:ferric-dicitrate binding protein FerR (iron transport regulator)
MTDAYDRESQAADNADAVAELIRTAGRRVEPPSAAYERALAAATAALETKLRRRTQKRWSIAVAASALLAAIALTLSIAPQDPARIAARTDRIIGAVEVKTDGGGWTALSADAVDLQASTEIRTRAGSGAGLVLAGGASLRLADATHIALQSDSRVHLLNGKVYLDTGATTAAQQVEVVTAAGSAIDIGTQFEVLYRDDAYRLRVREGRVRLDRGPDIIDSQAGEQLTIDARGLVARTQLQADDADWEWAQALAPPPDIDGRPLSVLLAWVARETGKTIRFEQPELERKAQTTILHGSIRLLAPLDALAAMLATTDLEHVLADENTILIRLRAANQ